MREEMNQKEERSEKEILQEQLECARKQMRYSRVTCIMATVMALALVISAVFVVPSLNRAADSIAQVSGQLEELQLQDLELAETLKDIDEFVITSEKGVQKTIEKLDAVDLEKLNEAIEALRNVVEPLRRIFG
ncbi:MAG TPA: hypothetical protein IAA03_05895 [Candidatus Ruminococcus avistercoris]|nr:hypothetical protein [Candidatus Ruminococcus avistercoris]